MDSNSGSEAGMTPAAKLENLRTTMRRIQAFRDGLVGTGQKDALADADKYLVALTQEYQIQDGLRIMDEAAANEHTLNDNCSSSSLSDMLGGIDPFDNDELGLPNLGFDDFTANSPHSDAFNFMTAYNAESFGPEYANPSPQSLVTASTDPAVPAPSAPSSSPPKSMLETTGYITNSEAESSTSPSAVPSLTVPHMLNQRLGFQRNIDNNNHQPFDDTVGNRFGVNFDQFDGSDEMSQHDSDLGPPLGFMSSTIEKGKERVMTSSYAAASHSYNAHLSLPRGSQQQQLTRADRSASVTANTHAEEGAEEFGNAGFQYHDVVSNPPSDSQSNASSSPKVGHAVTNPIIIDDSQGGNTSGIAAPQGTGGSQGLSAVPRATASPRAIATPNKPRAAVIPKEIRDAYEPYIDSLMRDKNFTFTVYPKPSLGRYIKNFIRYNHREEAASLPGEDVKEFLNKQNQDFNTKFYYYKLQQEKYRKAKEEKAQRGAKTHCDRHRTEYLQEIGVPRASAGSKRKASAPSGSPSKRQC